jgi:hypothetical protein
LGRHQFERYLEKVFRFSALVGDLPDGRLYPQHDLKQIFDAVFLGSACQFTSVHQIETECRCGALCKRIGPLSEDTIRYALERLKPAAVTDIWCTIARQLKRNGVFNSSWARGRVVAAADGIEICSSFRRCCDACLERTVKHMVDGEMREDIQYYHRISVVTIVSAPFPIPLGLRFQQKGETEVECTRALLQDLRGALGHRFFDLLVGDAIYLQSPFVKAVEKMGLDWVFNLKANQPELLLEAERTTEGKPDSSITGPREELSLWYVEDAYWPVADRSVVVVKTVRRQSITHVAVHRDKAGNKTMVKEKATEQSTNFYASNLVLGSIPPLFIHQLGRSRWSIDTEVFQVMTTEGNLKRPSIHQGHDQALVVLTMIRLLAYLLTMVFYHRQVCSHFSKPPYQFCDLARRLAYLFLASSPPSI